MKYSFELVQINQWDGFGDIGKHVFSIRYDCFNIINTMALIPELSTYLNLYTE